MQATALHFRYVIMLDIAKVVVCFGKASVSL